MHTFAESGFPNVEVRCCLSKLVSKNCGDIVDGIHFKRQAEQIGGV